MQITRIHEKFYLYFFIVNIYNHCTRNLIVFCKAIENNILVLLLIINKIILKFYNLKKNIHFTFVCNFCYNFPIYDKKIFI